MKKILNITIWIILITGLLFLAGFIDKEQKNSRCKKLIIEIDYNKSNPLITDKNIKEIICKSAGIETLVGQTMSDINFKLIEHILNETDYIKKADIFSTTNGNIKVKIIQRQPIVRIINKKYQSFYIDDESMLMPLNRQLSARVLIANGNINESFTNSNQLIQNYKNDTLNKLSTLYKIFMLAKYIQGNEFLKAQIEQVYINKKGEIELLPKIGKHLIIFGDIDNMNKKFEKLVSFYKKGLKKAGWDKYKTINLKYKNQVVCSKN
ncbi:MAG: hypothetical protein K8R58_12870 [Bacteroidales bacterium]|nr:hypothetical protein [Bacteroidales bacterium]